MKPFGTQSFLIGIGIAAISYLFGSQIKRGAKEITVKRVQGALMAGEAATNVVGEGKNKVSNLINNVVGTGKQKQNMQIENSQVMQQLINEIKAERQQNKEMVESLLNEVKNLKDDISNLKNSATNKKEENQVN